MATPYRTIRQLADNAGDYPARWAAAAAVDVTLCVIVPLPPFAALVDPAAGCVASPADGGRAVVDAESNRLGATNLTSFFDKLHHAAGRHVVGYPTAARWTPVGDQVRDVGCYDVATGTTTITDWPALEAWTGIDAADLRRPHDRLDPRQWLY